MLAATSASTRYYEVSSHTLTHDLYKLLRMGLHVSVEVDKFTFSTSKASGSDKAHKS